MKGYYLDTESGNVRECYAIIYVPGRRRDRFPEGAVEVVDSEQAAREGADANKKRYAARVLGPARSSEGLRLYYLLQWLD